MLGSRLRYPDEGTMASSYGDSENDDCQLGAYGQTLDCVLRVSAKADAMVLLSADKIACPCVPKVRWPPVYSTRSLPRTAGFGRRRVHATTGTCLWLAVGRAPCRRGQLIAYSAEVRK
jgi:hypothetical protein